MVRLVRIIKELIHHLFHEGREAPEGSFRMTAADIAEKKADRYQRGNIRGQAKKRVY